MVSAWASVLAAMNSVPWSCSAIMLLTALPPPPPTPITVILGLISEISGFLYSAMPASPSSLALFDDHPRAANAVQHHDANQFIECLDQKARERPDVQV